MGPSAKRARAFPLALLASATAAAYAAGQAPPQNQQPPTYRAAVMLVPVDVRVIDTKTGLAITDLKREDFTVFEDNVRQDIRHFAQQSFGPPPSGEAPDAAAAAAAPAGKPAARLSPLGVVPQTRRVFLLVLGRGRLQGGPSKALDAAAHFVRGHLLPGDYVSVFGYDRATDFTADHEQAALVIDRFKAENDAIAGELAQRQGGLAAIYGSRELPVSVQQRINYIFKGTGTLPYSLVGGAASTAQNTAEAKRDSAYQVDRAMDRVIASGRMTPASESGEGGPAPLPSAAWEAFDAFAARNMQTLDDTQNLYAAIAYMQRLEGEKHLVFLTPYGMSLRHLEDYQQISQAAADARVALDVVQSGFGDVLHSKAMRSLSDDTGGVSSIAEYGQAALDRVDLTTRTGYLLGYYPSNSRRTGDYRQIRVTVNRPDATVLFRHGYRASEEIPTFDRRDYITQFRMRAAATYGRDIKDIGVKMHATVAQEQGRFRVTVDAMIDASRLVFTLRDGEQVGRFDIAVVFWDAKGNMLGGQSRTLDARFTPERFARIQKEGLACTMGTEIPSGARYVRFIVYDYDADLVGTAGSYVF